MEKLLISIGLIILITILSIMFIDYKLYKKLIRFKRNEKEISVSDEKYHELNYKIQLLITSASIIIVVGGFLGYSSILSIKSEYVENVKQYKEKLIRYDSTILKYENLVVEIDSQRIKTINALNVSVNETNRLKAELINLQREFSPTLKTYIIRNIEFDLNKEGNVRIYYKNLRTIEGQKLPYFSEPPILTVLSSGTSIIHIINNTTEYFEYLRGLSVELEDKDANRKNNKFDLMITKYK